MLRQVMVAPLKLLLPRRTYTSLSLSVFALRAFFSFPWGGAARCTTRTSGQRGHAVFAALGWLELLWNLVYSPVFLFLIGDHYLTFRRYRSLSSYALKAPVLLKIFISKQEIQSRRALQRQNFFWIFGGKRKDFQFS
jgi:hypothetical protein